MEGRVGSLYRYPVKGFTPERLGAVMLEAGGNFPCDRLYAVERGPSGFDPDTPAFISKWRFTVLANHPKLARAVTAFDPASSTLSLTIGERIEHFDLHDHAGRQAFADWLAAYLGEDEEMGPLHLIEAGPRHRFTDDCEGWVSLINLASLRDLAAKLERGVDPLRMRANLYVEGWPAWAELDLPAGTRLRLGESVAEVVKPIPRCIATHVDPVSGERDLDLVPALRSHYGHGLCGLYLKPIAGGGLAEGDLATLVPAHPAELSP